MNVTAVFAGQAGTSLHYQRGQRYTINLEDGCYHCDGYVITITSPHPRSYESIDAFFRDWHDIHWIDPDSGDG